MATTTAGRGGVKERSRDAGREAGEVVTDQLEELARQGAREMLMAALQEERDAYLGRGRYERSDVRRGYRNGTTPRRLTLGGGTVPLGVPRVRDIPAGQEPFESQILRKHQRRSDTVDETYMRLFIEGLATRDFEPALRLLAGEQAPLSPSTISRLTQKFKGQYAAFEKQDLGERKYVYIWADGIVRHEAPWNRVGCKDPPLGLSQQATEAGGSLILEAQEKAEAASTTTERNDTAR
jgi:transposase-like protein